MVNSEDRKPSRGQRIDDVDPSDSIGGDRANQSVTRRLTEIFMEDGDEDLLLQRSDREDGVLQWLRALDMQVMGACRADERLKPLLKLNASADVAEDPLLAHLSQHFEPAEVAMLARCLCIPLVSIRVGKINKQGTFFYPTSIRGNLCLMLLPTSDLRISFNGDDGYSEKLLTLSTGDQCNGIEIEDIPADKTGRSFLIKTLDGVVSYFWCSEKSQLLGTELRRKMKDLLIKKPSLAELTGINYSRLNHFASHFRAYLAGSVVTTTPAVDLAVSSGIDFSSLEPGTSSIEESLRKCVAREKLGSISESYDLSVASSDPCFQENELPETTGTTAHSLALLNFLDIAAAEVPREIQVPSPGPFPTPFSPHCCWCPPVALPMQSTLGNPQLLPVSSTELPLPPLSVLLADIPPFPTLPSESRVQQIPTFTPLICDPIIHIPVIDVCSSGQGYFVSGGPAMPTTIPPVVVVDPLLPKTGESVVEKSARETLRMLISNQSNPLVLANEGRKDGDGGMLSILLMADGKRFVWRENMKDEKEKGWNNDHNPSGCSE